MNKPNWDQGDHDEQVARYTERIIKERCGQIYTKWKNKVLSLPKKKRTQTHIVKMLAELRKEMEKITATPGLEPWKAFTLDVIDHVIERANISIGMASNTFTEYVPAMIKRKARSWPFKCLIDFYKIPPIAELKGSEGFVGLLRDNMTILAFYLNGEMIPIGTVKHLEGTVLMPTMTQFQEELKSARTATGSSAAGSSEPTDTSPGSPASN